MKNADDSYTPWVVVPCDTGSSSTDMASALPVIAEMADRKGNLCGTG